ncbi:MAG: SIR2 family protein [Ignavibacteria bacterium]|nr:SIR2 family protein [Ignavibacteria bacterium]
MPTRTVVDDAVLNLSERLGQKNCILIVGDEIAPTQQAISDLQYLNLPTKREMLERLRRSRTYITENMSFSQELSMKETAEGRPSILTFIREQYSPNLRNPFPIHDEIARLSLNSIITTNWDSLLEKAFGMSDIPHQVIIGDDDIPLFRSDAVSVIKLFGSLDRGNIVGTSDDMHDFFPNSPLLGSFIKVICAQRTLLFIGYRLDDPDFLQLFQTIRRELGKFMTTSYIVSPEPNRFDIDYWARHHAQIIPAEPLDFIQRLNAQLLLNSSEVLGVGATHIDESLWMDNPFFRPLFQIRSLPTESQVVDGILKNTLKILDSPATLDEIGVRVISAVEQIAGFRPNYSALAILARERMRKWFPPYTQAKEQVRSMIEKELLDRNQGKDIIGEKGAHIIEPDDKLLLYVQSTRVHAVVNTWLQKNPRRTSSLELIIPEARPKSPTPFQDALATARAINNQDVKMTLIPDVSIGYLMEKNGISKIFFGAHKIVEYVDGTYTVTNVTGTLLIAKLALQYQIPIYVFAEEDKIYSEEDVQTYPDLVATTVMPEEQLMPRRTRIYDELLRTRRMELFNPGYDDISSSQIPFTLVTNKREIIVGPKVK